MWRRREKEESKARLAKRIADERAAEEAAAKALRDEVEAKVASGTYVPRGVLEAHGLIAKSQLADSVATPAVAANTAANQPRASGGDDGDRWAAKTSSNDRPAAEPYRPRGYQAPGAEGGGGGFNRGGNRGDAPSAFGSRRDNAGGGAFGGGDRGDRDSRSGFGGGGGRYPAQSAAPSAFGGSRPRDGPPRDGGPAPYKAPERPQTSAAPARPAGSGGYVPPHQRNK